MKHTKLILFTIVSLIFTDSVRYISWSGTLNIDSATYICALLNYISLSIFIFIASTSYSKDLIPFSIRSWYKIWLLWLIFNLIRGAFLSQNYWDWKFLLLESMFFSFVPLAYFLGQDLDIVKFIFKFIISYLFAFGFLFIPLTLITNPELYSRLMIPIGLFILFIPYLKSKWKLLVIIVALTSMLMVLDFRSNILKIGFSVMLLPIYYFRKFIGKNLIRWAHLILFALPLVLFILAVSGVYNVFEKASDNEGFTVADSQGGEEESLTADTRTFLYVEVLSSLNNSGNLLIGESASGKYKTDYFDLVEGNGNYRYGSEVGILNILLYHGVIGVVIYFFLLLTVSYVAIYQSNNILSKMLGLFIAFRWTFSFVEEFTQFDLNFYIFWIIVGLVSSATFRNMNDDEIKNYLKLE